MYLDGWNSHRFFPSFRIYRTPLHKFNKPFEARLGAFSVCSPLTATAKDIERYFFAIHDHRRSTIQMSQQFISKYFSPAGSSTKNRKSDGGHVASHASSRGIRPALSFQVPLSVCSHHHSAMKRISPLYVLLHLINKFTFPIAAKHNLTWIVCFSSPTRLGSRTTHVLTFIIHHSNDRIFHTQITDNSSSTFKQRCS